VERRQLRSYLLQSQWFSGTAATPLTPKQLSLLKELPIFEVHAATAVDKVLQAGQSPTAAAAAAGAGGLTANSAQLQSLLSGRFVSLSAVDTQQQQQQAVLAPSGMPAALLGSRYLRCDSDVEEQLLQQHLGVLRPPLTSFLLEHVAVAADQLDATALAGAAALLLGRLDTEPALLDILG
jgi:sacsin